MLRRIGLGVSEYQNPENGLFSLNGFKGPRLHFS